LRLLLTGNDILIQISSARVKLYVVWEGYDVQI